MATLATRNPTYRDILSGLTSDKKIDKEIVELFVEENPILDDIVIKEANEGMTNLSTIRAGMPSVAWNAIYEGVQPSKGSKRQVKDAAGHAESLIEVAERLYEIAPDKPGFLLDEATTHAEAMGQEIADALIYGNISVNAKKFNGLAVRFPTHGSNDEDLTSFYVLNGSRASNNSTAALRSIWLVGHGTKSIHGFYPKGTSGGLKRGAAETGLWAQDANGGQYKVVRQLFSWDIGLAVKDFRFAGRISNIESDAMFGATGMPDYLELLRRLSIRVRSAGVRQCLYMPKLVLEMLNVLAGRLTQENAVRTEDLFGRKITSVMGIPVRTLDCMNIDETATTSV
jgi:hypothetical protein